MALFIKNLHPLSIDLKPSFIIDLERAINISFIKSNNCLVKNSYWSDKDNTITHLRIDNNIDKIIDLKYFVDLKRLYLSSNRIRKIEGIGNLNNLEILYLNGNRIEKIEGLENLKNLKILHLGNNEIKRIEGLNNLKNLETLYLNKNQIQKIEGLEFLTKLKEINLNNNLIEKIEGLENLKNLEALYLNRNEIKEVVGLENLNKLKKLALNNNLISIITGIQYSKDLSLLSLKNNRIESLGDCSEIINLISLQNLNLAGNPIYKHDSLHIKDIAELKGELTKLLDKITDLVNHCNANKYIKLDLGRLGINNLSLVPNLFECDHLEELILSNEWAEYDNDSNKWVRKESVNQGEDNIIKTLPAEFEKLKNLRILIIGGNWYSKDKSNKWAINDITVISNLQNLEVLNISNNEISGDIDISKLKKLKYLYLNNNNIENISSLDEFNSLKEIYVSNNNIKDAEFLANLKNVETIDLHNNQIRSLKILEDLLKRRKALNLTNTKWEKNTINLYDNPLIEPSVETINSGKDVVLRYFNDIKYGKTYINNEIKLILVGNSEVGKSTLVKYLKKESNINTTATHWMEELSIESGEVIQKINKKCKIRILDFGGHDFYHDTHHLFFSSNTIYFLIWDKNTNNLKLRVSKQDLNGKLEDVEIQDYPLKYWLNSIKYFIKEKKSNNFDFKIEKENDYKSSVLLIQNKVFNCNDIEHLNNKNIYWDFPFVYDFINIAIKEGRNLYHFESLFYEMLNNIQIIGAILPEYQGKIKELIENNQSKLPAIQTIKQLKVYLQSHGIKATDHQVRDACCYLKQIGLILYFPEYENDKVYVNKNWVINNIYKILIGLKEKKGEFDRKHISDALNNKETDDTIDSLILLMKNFKMIFENPFTHSYIAPLYLPLKPDKGVNLFLLEKRISYRRLEFKGFIHKSIVLDFYQEYGKLTTCDDSKKHFYYWKDGLIIKDNDSGQILLIEFNIGNEDGRAFIDIIKINNNDTYNIFVDNVIKYLKKINIDYGIDKQEIEEMVTLDGIDFVSIEILNENAKKNKHLFYERKIDDFKTNNDLNALVKEKAIKLKDYNKFLIEKLDMFKIFISYSKDDLELVNSYIRSLKPLVLQGSISDIWYCTSLSPGEDVHEKISKKIEEADIVIFMCSNNFFSTPYIIEKELKKTLERKKNGSNQIIIPIIVDRCKWISKNEDINLGKFAGFPYRGKPVSDFDNWNDAWYVMNYFLEQIIEKKVQPNEEYDVALTSEIEQLLERQIKGKLDK